MGSSFNNTFNGLGNFRGMVDKMKKKIINDLDHFRIIDCFKKKDFKYLEKFQEFMIKSLGKEKCLLKSEFSHFKEASERMKELIKFPFEIPKMNKYNSYWDPGIIDLTRGITYKRAKLSSWKKIKIFFGFMKEPKRIRVKEKSLYDLILKVKPPKFKYKIGDIT